MKGPLHLRFTSKSVLTVSLIVLAVLGALLVGLSTRWGIGCSPDSVFYISLARSLQAGEGYRGLYGVPRTEWPPLYPSLLALAGLTGPDPQAAARWINAGRMLANVLLVGLILRQHTRLWWMPLLGAWLTLTSVDLLTIHSMAWSEPLFIVLSLVALALMAAYAQRQSCSLLLAAAAATAAATLTRYAGLSLVATGVTVAALLTRAKLARRVARCAMFAVPASVPFLCWMIRNALVAGKTTGRTLRYHPMTLLDVQIGLKTVSLWFLPHWVPLPVKIAAVLAAAGALIFTAIVVTRTPREPRPLQSAPCRSKLLEVMAISLGFSIALLVFTLFFIERHMVLRLRQMAPFFPIALLSALIVGDRLLGEPKRLRPLKTAWIAVLILAALWFPNRAGWWISWIRGEGLGLSRRKWRESELIEHIKQLDPAVPLFSTGRRIVYYHTGRVPTRIPDKMYWTGKPNERFEGKIGRIREQLESEGGFLIYFGERTTTPPDPTSEMVRRALLPSARELEEALPLRVILETPDGVIYEARR